MPISYNIITTTYSPSDYNAILVSMQARRRAIRAFLGTDIWTDEKLCGLLAHAQSGKLAFVSCCCLVGSATADHALKGVNHDYGWSPHYQASRQLPFSPIAEHAFLHLLPQALRNGTSNLAVHDAARCRILIPIIRAELRRRERLRQSIAPVSTLEMASV
jgi:hypothetical protein